MRLLLTFCFLVFTQVSLAIGPSATIVDENPLSHATALTLSSTILENPPKVHVYLPEDYYQMADHIRYPVIYTLDGWVLSQSVAGVITHLGQTAGMPKAIVVAIDSDEDYAWGPEIYASKSGWRVAPDSRLDGFAGGEADKYLAFMQEELVPLIDKTYRTHDFRVLIGMSPSAAFTLHTLWKSPELFNAHIVFAATDVIGMGYSPDTTFIEKIAESLAKTPDRKGYLYVASAQQEAASNPARQSNVTALQEALKPYTSRNFKLRVEHIDNYGHYSMALPGLLSALDLIFPRKDWDMSMKFREFLQQEKPVDALFAYYDSLSSAIGFTVTPNTDLRRNANCLRAAASRLRGQEKYHEAERIYHYWIEVSPQAAKAWAGLAATFEAKGDITEATQTYQRALVFAKQQQLAYLVPLIEEKLASLNPQ
ncbi:alpha/beta hydrolase [Alteromonas facilis]|uniref:alpha/beta hydrolase n=1 Tax=Alteromonas facilis TaxID=2048004 RepID=UPI000C28FA4B|nr:alpha/beta hydrolase-fold protein [Alteromonas facilis]